MSLNNIHIIGLAVAEKIALEVAAQKALAAADMVIGSARQLAMIAEIDCGGLQCELPKLPALKTLIEESNNKNIVILASGDPLYFGIARWLYSNFPEENIRSYAAVSSIQAACHRLGLALQDAEVISLHGRPLASIKPLLKHNQTLIALTDNLSRPKDIAAECIAAGFADSRITVCENLAYTTEQLRSYKADDLVNMQMDFSELNVCVINISGQGGVQAEFPGIPDHHFQTGERPCKGMISKREVRLCILSLMQVEADDVVWDIGAGCGGVSVELAYWQKRARVYALEFHPERLAYLRENRLRFGTVTNLHVVEGRAPEALPLLPSPTKVFIGGSDGELPMLLKSIWEQLPERGVLVASAVIESTKNALAEFAKPLNSEQVECLELSVKRGSLENAATEQAQLDFVQKLPVEVFKFTKMGDE